MPPKHIIESRTRSEIAFAPYVEAFCIERGWTMSLDQQIGIYFPDMVIISQKIVIEIDGSAHEGHLKMAKDFKRNSYMRKHGWVIFRFMNEEVAREPEKCIDDIRRFLRHNLILS